jgi:hypothetical protein
MTLNEVIQLCVDRAADTVTASADVATVLGGLRWIGAVAGDDKTPAVKGWMDVTRLPQRVQPLVPMALTAGALLWLARDAGLTWHLASVVAVVNGVLGGFVASGMAHDTPRLIRGGKRVGRGLAAGAAALLLVGCASWQDTAQTGLDVAQAVCENELLQELLREDRMLSPVAADLAENACTVLAATEPGLQAILAQADQARAPRGRILAAEARARGAL